MWHDKSRIADACNSDGWARYLIAVALGLCAVLAPIGLRASSAESRLGEMTESYAYDCTTYNAGHPDSARHWLRASHTFSFSRAAQLSSPLNWKL